MDQLPEVPQPIETQPTGRLTKNELRIQRRAERKQEQRAHNKSLTTKRIVLWSSVVVGIALVVWGMVALVKGDSKPTGPVPGVNEVTAEDHVTANVNSPVTLIEYGDFQCPACGAYYPIVKQVKKDYADKFRFVFRHFPLPQHQHARLAAYASEAASMQGKFWEMHDKLYEGQADWSEVTDSKARSVIEGYAKDIGLDVEKFKTDWSSSAAKAPVDGGVASGTKGGVNSTPTFFLNGTRLDARSADDFKKAIDAALTK